MGTESHTQFVIMRDAGLAVLLTQHRAWMTTLSPGRLLVIVPSERDRGYWYYALFNTPAGEIEGAIRPVHRDALAFFIREYGVAPDADWNPCERYLPGDPNPVMDGRGDHAAC